MKKLKIRSTHHRRSTYSYSVHRVIGEPGKQVVIKVDGKIIIRKLSKVNGWAKPVESQGENEIQVKYLDLDF